MPSAHAALHAMRSVATAGELKGEEEAYAAALAAIRDEHRDSRPLGKGTKSLEAAKAVPTPAPALPVALTSAPPTGGFAGFSSSSDSLSSELHTTYDTDSDSWDLM